MKFNVKAFALTTGIFWGIGLLLITWWIILFEGTSCEVTLIGYVYRGYSISIAGSFIGFAWGFVDGIIGGAIFAWLYNLLSGRFANS
jgi:hypothetical protein